MHCFSLIVLIDDFIITFTQQVPPGSPGVRQGLEIVTRKVSPETDIVLRYGTGNSQ